MPYERPNLTELLTESTQDMAAGSGPLLRFANLRIVAKVWAGLASLIYGFLDWISLQAVPFTATAEYLEGWAALKGVTRKPAQAWAGTATWSALAGSTIADLTPCTRSDGAAYTVQGAVTAGVGGTITVALTADVAGSSGNNALGEPITLGISTAGVQSTGTVAGLAAAGTDAESDADFRTRMLAVYAAPPQGGDRADYVEWALAVEGVTRAWCIPNGMGVGTVIVYTMFDATDSAYAGFPQGTTGTATAETRDAHATGDLLIVANAIEPLRPVTALVYAFAPTAYPIAVTVADLGAANTAANQAAITAALTDMVLRQGQVGGAIDPSTGLVFAAIEPDAWYSAIAAVTGLTGFKVAAPTAAVLPPRGGLPTVGAITFVA